MEPKFNLFLNDGKVWELANPDTDQEVEREYKGPWPVRAWFTSTDHGDGHGWQRELFEKHGKIVTDHLHDAGAGDTTQAVLVDVKSPESFTILASWFNLEDSVPAEL